MALLVFSLVFYFATLVVKGAKREYSACFTLSQAMDTDVWIQWSVGPSFSSLTPWYNIGNLSASRHKITINSDDIGSDGFEFRLGMYGKGVLTSMSSTLSNVTTMNGISTDEILDSDFSFSFTALSSNCYVIILNTYDDSSAHDGPTTLGCNDFYDLESNTYESTQEPTKNPSLVPTAVPSYHPSTQPTNEPTMNPSLSPTFSPSIYPTNIPSMLPTQSSNPTNSPSMYPTTHDKSTIYPTTYSIIYPTIDSSNRSNNTIVNDPNGQNENENENKDSNDKSNEIDYASILIIAIGTLIVFLCILSLVCGYCVTMKNRQKLKEKQMALKKQHSNEMEKQKNKSNSDELVKNEPKLESGLKSMSLSKSSSVTVTVINFEAPRASAAPSAALPQTDTNESKNIMIGYDVATIGNVFEKRNDKKVGNLSKEANCHSIDQVAVNSKSMSLAKAASKENHLAKLRVRSMSDGSQCADSDDNDGKQSEIGIDMMSDEKEDNMEHHYRNDTIGNSLYHFDVSMDELQGVSTPRNNVKNENKGDNEVVKYNEYHSSKDNSNNNSNSIENIEIIKQIIKNKERKQENVNDDDFDIEYKQYTDTKRTKTNMNVTEGCDEYSESSDSAEREGHNDNNTKLNQNTLH